MSSRLTRRTLSLWVLAVPAALAQTVAAVEPGLGEIAAIHRFAEAVISPNGTRVAYVEVERAPFQSAIQVVGAASIRISAGDGKNLFDEHGVAWSPDGAQIAFLSDHEKRGQLQLYVAPAEGGAARQLTHAKGLLREPRWSPDGRQVAVLFTENLPRSAGPLDPVLPTSGVVASKFYEQRIALVDVATAGMRFVSQPDLYIYEYDWSPDGKSFAATGAHGDGDDNWWIAQLYTVPAATGAARPVYKPGVQQQIAAPRWTADGESIVFIGGLMSDEGSTGGDLFEVSAEGGPARDLTPGIASSLSGVTRPRDSRTFFLSEHFDGGSAISQFDPGTGEVKRLWHGDESINPQFDDSGPSMSADGKTAAVIRTSFAAPPEVWMGPIGAWRQVTRENRARKVPWGGAKNLHWMNDGFRIQGCLSIRAGSRGTGNTPWWCRSMAGRRRR